MLQPLRTTLLWLFFFYVVVSFFFCLKACEESGNVAKMASTTKGDNYLNTDTLPLLEKFVGIGFVTFLILY